MAAWITWRTACGSIAVGIAIAAALFLSSERSLTLSGLDLFFAVTTALSLGLNLWQLLRDRYKYRPLRDSFVGLFNDIKGRQLRAYQRQMLIISPAGLQLPVEAVRLEFFDFVQESNQSFEQLREHVVAAIHTLDPEASTQQVFRAAEFGLTDDERKLREQGLARFRENAGIAAGGAAQAPTRIDHQRSTERRPESAKDEAGSSNPDQHT